MLYYYKQANEELGRRVRSWKAAYVTEVERREALEKELFDALQVLLHGYNDNSFFRLRREVDFPSNPSDIIISLHVYPHTYFPAAPVSWFSTMS